MSRVSLSNSFRSTCSTFHQTRGSDDVVNAEEQNRLMLRNEVLPETSLESTKRERELFAWVLQGYTMTTLIITLVL